jgi:hypothetical protein
MVLLVVAGAVEEQVTSQTLPGFMAQVEVEEQVFLLVQVVLLVTLVV